MKEEEEESNAGAGVVSKCKYFGVKLRLTAVTCVPDCSHTTAAAAWKCQELSWHVTEGHTSKPTFSLFLQYCPQEDLVHPRVLCRLQNEAHFPPQALHGRM